MAFAARMGFIFLLKYYANEPAWHWLKTEWAWLWMEWYATYNNQSETHFATCLHVTLSHYGYCVDEIIWCQLCVFTIIKIKYKGHHIQYWPRASPANCVNKCSIVAAIPCSGARPFIFCYEEELDSIYAIPSDSIPCFDLSINTVSRATEKSMKINRTNLNALIMVPTHFKYHSALV